MTLVFTFGVEGENHTGSITGTPFVVTTLNLVLLVHNSLFLQVSGLMAHVPRAGQVEVYIALSQVVSLGVYHEVSYSGLL